jgi:NAD(P)-dependent dehydrogenase (short-subunit alcohol dehydrogenase family)
MNRHDNTIAVVTGGTQGVGFAICRRLIAEGARALVICGRNPARGAEAAAELATLGADCRYVRADMAQPADCVRVVETALNAFGRVNALVNSAATAPRGTLLETDLALWEEIMAVNLRGPFLTMQRTVRALKEAGEPGSIVNILSTNALCGQTFLTAYSASKGGLATLTKNVANAFAKDRIRCNGVILGWTDTPGEEVIQRRFHGRDSSWVDEAAQHLPMGQLIHPDELSGLVTYLLSPESGVMTGALIEYDQFVTGARPE